jgi:two-component system sensor histidine kinase ArlS
MKIKFKITLLFTIVVMLIFVVLGLFVYYFSSLNRKSEFSTRLKNRALTTTRLLFEVEEINTSLLKKIDSLTMNLLFEERIAVYNYKNELLYSNKPLASDPLHPTPALLHKIRLEKEYKFSEGEFEAVGVMYMDKINSYTILASAIDRTGKNSLKQLKKILLLSGMIGILITLLGGYFFSINLLRPLSKMNQEMNEISLQNISHRIPANLNKDELNELATTFNSLLERLEVSFNNQKSFIANASHELATPLSAVSSQLDVALMQDRSIEEYRNVVASVHEDVTQLNNLVRQLLELAKAGSGKEIVIEPVRIDEIILDAVEEVNAHHDGYRVSLTFDEMPEEESLCYIYGNEKLLFIAFKNIIENACKYSPSHKAWVSIAIDPGKKIIRIKDEGIGIPEEEMEKIFEPFFRSDSAKKISEGLGLGLSMSSRIIRLHKGEIAIESVPGQGSTFMIILPSL